MLIPSYNEAKAIGSLIQKVRAQNIEVVVVDDGSIDQTAEIAHHCGADVIKHIRNKGKGASLKAGFTYVLNKSYDAVITMDADGQHSPEDIPKFLQAANDPNFDMIVGNRMVSKKEMPRLRWLTNNFMSNLISAICRSEIKDSQCGFRLIKKKLLEQLNPISSNYEIESETIVEAKHKGFNLKFIPIQTIYTKQKSQINPIIDTIRFFKFILKIYYPVLFNKK